MEIWFCDNDENLLITCVKVLQISSLKRIFNGSAKCDGVNEKI